MTCKLWHHGRTKTKAGGRSITLEFPELSPTVLPECDASEDGERRSVAVLIPVRNKSRLIAETIRSVAPQLRNGDRLIVVADNCSDNTAASLPALPSRTPSALGAL
jgi:hypothetical protein